MTEKPETWQLKTGVVAAAYVLLVIGISIWTYWHAWQEALQSLDQRLLAGAASIRFVLADDFHDRAVDADAVDVDEDERNIRELSALARRSGFTFLYTVIRKDGRFRLTSSNATAEELAANEEVRYFDSYDEAQHLRDVFAATNILYTSYKDRWGEFRSALLPEVSPGGNFYVSGAEADVGYVRALLRHQLLQAIAVALVLLMSALPLFLIYIQKQRRHARALTIANDRLTREMAERKAIEKELIRSHNAEALGTLAGGVAHDFNNILAAIQGHAELALDLLGPDSPAAEDIAGIRRAGDRAKDLTRQILTFARKTGSEAKPVEVSAVAREVMGLIRSFVPSTIRLQEKLTSTSCVMSDPVSVHQILMNLCTNAVQAMKETGGRLDVEVTDVELEPGAHTAPRKLPPGKYVQATVSDTGTGIAPEIIDSIFEPYFTTKGPGAGTGLGLAVVHGIVTGLDGDISVRSTPGQGTMFTVLLPALAGNPERPPPPDALRVLAHGTERILVVDDEPAVAHTNARLLERLGYRVTTHTSSEEALAHLRADPAAIDLLLTDMTMPGLTGDKLAAAATAIRPGLPVILCTGNSESVAHLPPRTGITRILNKPFSGQELAGAVRAALGGAIAP